MTPTVARQIPVYKPALAGREKEYVTQCVDSSWISSKGEFVSRFEQGFAAYVGAPHATTVSNGTVALHLALLALGIGPGDEVIVPALTYIAPVNMIALTGARPVFVDSVSATWTMDPEAVAAAITPRTKAILAVHLYGTPCDMDALAALAAPHRLAVIEDCAEAFGTRLNGRHVGGWGDVSTFSFFGNKTLTTGEGGMVISPRAEAIEKVAHLKNQAVSPQREYWHDDVGFNYRMTNIAAAIGVAQLERADGIIARKRDIALRYQEALAGTPLVFQTDGGDIFNSFWMVSILAANRAQRDLIRAGLREQGVETRPFFIPAHRMPVFQSDEHYPIAESLSDRGINLPSYPGLADDDVRFIAGVIKECLNG